MFEEIGNGRKRVSAEISGETWQDVYLALGLAMGSAFQIGNTAGWRFVEFMNELNRGNPRWDVYEIPADRRNTPFQANHIRVIDPQSN